MYTEFIILITTYTLNSVCASDIYHVNSKVTFRPDAEAGYFGYSVVLTEKSLIVGAPKAMNRDQPQMTSGLVFTCGLENFDQLKNATCQPIGYSSENNRNGPYDDRYRLIRNFLRDDMWFGATIANIGNEKILICAPRWAEPFRDKHLLANGVCYLRNKQRDYALYPLSEKYRQAFITDGRRKEYGDLGTHLNFYAYGQAGISVKVTGNNSVIIGAPGLLQWTGGIVTYNYYPDEDNTFLSKQPTTNPYYTKELGPDDYFGYSVEWGTFIKDKPGLFVAGAPRSKAGYGQVLIFEPSYREQDSLRVKYKLKGPQLGAYYGATLCCADIDGDGLSDLLVGAPNYVRDVGLPHDQGAVFVYMTLKMGNNFSMQAIGTVTGSGQSGARFGSAIADLGDIDGDGYNDVAIGAPFENDGRGVVYIYRGDAWGLGREYTQRITAEGGRGFGYSISKGVDVDGNNCNDLAVGAHNSETVYIYRCIPTVKARATIKVPDAMNLPQNATGFTALFCVEVTAQPLWPHLKMDFKGKIIVDEEDHRAMISGDSEYKFSAKPGTEVCDEQNVEVQPTADLSKPISLKFELEPEEKIKNDTQTFIKSAVGLSVDSNLKSSFLIQLTRDCGEDLICTPWLVMSIDPLNNPYIPGSETKLGAKLTIFNKEEPAYGAKVNITLPMPPIRVPSECSLHNNIMICDVKAPLLRNEEIDWEIEMEYTGKNIDQVDLKITAELEDHLYNRNISENSFLEILIDVTPEANFSVSGKPLSNATLPVSRDKLASNENITFVHYYEITNYGPSDWYHLDALVQLPDGVSLATPLEGCASNDTGVSFPCWWELPAKTSLPVLFNLRYDLGSYGERLRENTTLNITTIFILELKNQMLNATITTTLVLDPAPPVWPLIVGLVTGLVLLAAIVYLLHRYGFFSRTQREQLKQLQEQAVPLTETEGCSTGTPSLFSDDSTHELLIDENSD